MSSLSARKCVTQSTIKFVAQYEYFKSDCSEIMDEYCNIEKSIPAIQSMEFKSRNVKMHNLDFS